MTSFTGRIWAVKHCWGALRHPPQQWRAGRKWRRIVQQKVVPDEEETIFNTLQAWSSSAKPSDESGFCKRPDKVIGTAR